MGTGGSTQASSPDSSRAFLLSQNYTEEVLTKHLSRITYAWLFLAVSTCHSASPLQARFSDRSVAVNVSQSRFAYARVLGVLSHTTCFPFSFTPSARFSDRSVSQALGRLVLVRSTPCRASTPSLLPRRLRGALLLSHEKLHLRAGFTLRCFQRLSLPDAATRQYGWRHNRFTVGPSTPVLSY